eukprot:1481414-Pleurochrysis_carterae.AAC.1
MCRSESLRCAPTCDGLSMTPYVVIPARLVKRLPRSCLPRFPELSGVAMAPLARRCVASQPNAQRPCGCCLSGDAREACEHHARARGRVHVLHARGSESACVSA